MTIGVAVHPNVNCQIYNDFSHGGTHRIIFTALTGFSQFQTRKAVKFMITSQFEFEKELSKRNAKSIR